MKRFALIGAAGYIAPRHMKAIKDTDNELVVAMDTFDSVGILDSYFPQADFFKEFERFERNVQLRKGGNKRVDFVSICSPNYLHDSHIRFALNNGAHAISEKPLVLNPWVLENLESLEKETGKNVYNILQLRLHPSIIALREKVLHGPKDKVYNIDLTYLTSRGTWYYSTWKADQNKSGGIATNIGVHFFDMLAWIFGDVKRNDSHLDEIDKAAGYLEFERARVRWFLSINPEMLPQQALSKGVRTFRSIKIDGEEFEFSDGFTDLHTVVYRDILDGNGYRVSHAKTAIEIVFSLRHKTPKGITKDSHPFCQKAIQTPFLGFSKDMIGKYLEKLV
ncbi:Gfo/Idh/MocA family oxidoreductase [Fastidiosibacter lacustris]|uniref:Gfo/Idh/MocA family oxidoreductase n=1 Tax=Fastidiosibacter lacustris TaxID=2056695 RepID=UPI000E3504DD|nr:Gfo/Idh/MocA family oxidoreductase [Fastidiosibacter lacustris]